MRDIWEDKDVIDCYNIIMTRRLMRIEEAGGDYPEGFEIDNYGRLRVMNSQILTYKEWLSGNKFYYNSKEIKADKNKVGFKDLYKEYVIDSFKVNNPKK
jgi:hypothetical protein